VTIKTFDDLNNDGELPGAVRCFMALLSYTSRLERLHVDRMPELDSTNAIGMAVCTSASTLRNLRARFDADSLFLAMPLIGRLTRLESLLLQVVETGQTHLGAAMLEHNVNLEPWTLDHLSSLRLLCSLQSTDPYDHWYTFPHSEACTRVLARWLSQCHFPALREVSLNMISLPQHEEGPSTLATFFDRHRGLRLVQLELYGLATYQVILPYVYSADLVLDAFAFEAEQSAIPYLSPDVQKLVLELVSLDEKDINPTIAHMDALARTVGQASGLRAIQFRAHEEATTPLDLRWTSLSRSCERQQKAFYKRVRGHTDRLKRDGIDVLDEDGQPAPA
jgi:hypothetical protein